MAYLSFSSGSNGTTLGTSGGVREPLEISRRVRKEIRGRTVHADVAADVSIAVSTGGTASVRQRSSISQGGLPPASAPDDKEQP